MEFPPMAFQLGGWAPMTGKWLKTPWFGNGNVGPFPNGLSVTPWLKYMGGDPNYLR